MPTLPNSPLGLPDGSIRGIIALALTCTLMQQTIVGAIDSVAFVGIAGPFLGYYVAQRGTEEAAKAAAVVAEPLPAPATAEDDA